MKLVNGTINMSEQERDLNDDLDSNLVFNQTDPDEYINNTIQFISDSENIDFSADANEGIQEIEDYFPTAQTLYNYAKQNNLPSIANQIATLKPARNQHLCIYTADKNGLSMNELKPNTSYQIVSARDNQSSDVFNITNSIKEAFLNAINEAVFA